jgi:hypothetical protein
MAINMEYFGSFNPYYFDSFNLLQYQLFRFNKTLTLKKIAS